MNTVILLISASSGIGEATARHLACLDHHTALSARRIKRPLAQAEKLQAQGQHASSRNLDVSELIAPTTASPYYWRPTCQRRTLQRHC